MKTKKILALALAAVLLVAVTVAGTIAYLVDTTDEVKNTFTTAGIDIDLTETDADWTMQMIPGTSKVKDPVVKVIRPETSVDIYLFVKFEETVDESVVTYTSNLTETNGWKLVDGQNNVWWREVKATDETIEWHLIAGDKVEVKSTVTAIPDDAATMVYTAYAIQTINGDGTTFTPEAAWAELNP